MALIDGTLPAGLEPWTAAVLLLCSLLTSMITASLGAGGGVLLLALLALWLPPAAIVPVHGLVQLGSNGGRALLTWRQVDWRLIAVFAPGVLLGVLLGAWLLVDLPAPLWQLAIGLFVLYLCWGPALPPRLLGRGGIFGAAVVTSFLSLFVGATGPLVAAFLRGRYRDRFVTVATFASAMSLQHAPKALVFGAAGFVLREWLWFIVAMIAAGLVGTWSGLRLLRRLDNRGFGHLFNLVLTLLALRLIWLATTGLLAPATPPTP